MVAKLLVHVTRVADPSPRHPLARGKLKLPGVRHHSTLMFLTNEISDPTSICAKLGRPILAERAHP
jgi:hypothetical protein